MEVGALDGRFFLVMNELEEILELLGHEPLLVVRDTLFELVGFCVKHI